MVEASFLSNAWVNSSTVNTSTLTGDLKSYQDIVTNLKSYQSEEELVRLAAETQFEAETTGLQEHEKLTQKSKRLSKLQEIKMQKKINMQSQSMLVKRGVQYLTSVKEMSHIATTLNRYIQAHDPYINNKFERYGDLLNKIKS